MEEMLGMEMRPPVCLRTFLNEYNELLQKDFPQPITYANIQDKMNLLDDAEAFENIVSNCSLEGVHQIDDACVSKFIPGFTETFRKNNCTIVDNEIKLQTFSKLNAFKNSNSKKNPFKRSRETFKMVPLPIKEEVHEKCDVYNDLIVNIRIYRPVRATHIGRTLEKPVFAEEFQCLGSNFLTELRDKITCVCNGKHFFDVSDNPTAPLPTKTIDPGYFFITDTFYNDHRNSNNLDYSEIIRKWAKRAVGLKNLEFKVAPMEQTRFIDLTVSLGFPQLYQHHGNCEHVFVISQVELLTPGAECLQRNHYPRLSSFSVCNHRMCHMCGIANYVYIVENSDRQLHNPGYLCKKCFFGYNYVNGEKIGEFQAYHLFDAVEIDKNEEATNDI